MKGHVDAVAEKYIKPAEGTYDFAFMYLPAEAIYYELVSGKTGALLDHAHGRRVFPTSATTFTAYLQVIAFGLKGMEFEQNAHEVMAYVADLRKDFLRMREDFELVGKHLSERADEVRRLREAVRPLRHEARARSRASSHRRARCGTTAGSRRRRLTPGEPGKCRQSRVV